VPQWSSAQVLPAMPVDSPQTLHTRTGAATRGKSGHTMPTEPKKSLPQLIKSMLREKISGQ
jgi:hypothetical protein